MLNCKMCGPQMEEDFYRYWSKNSEYYPYCKTCMKQRAAADQKRRRDARRAQGLVVSNECYKRSIQQGRGGEYQYYKKSPWSRRTKEVA